jgi:hypothetical protein
VTNILDVIDNFFDSKTDPNYLKLQEKDLIALAVEVRRYASAFSFPKVDESQQPIYLGGWPSANVWAGSQGNLILSSLLYAGQILGKDPICDWFSDEQYHLERMMAAPQGYIGRGKERAFNTVGTRHFLQTVVPQLRALRPLLDNNIVVLVPSCQIESTLVETIKELQGSLAPYIGKNILEFTRTFEPDDIPVGDNQRGMFLFPGGTLPEVEPRIRQFIDYSLYYFASEYCLATKLGFDYVAPFAYEHYICRQGLDSVIEAPGHKVVHAVLNSSLPMYSNLTPDLLVNLRNDENYGDFRVQLRTFYSNLPMNVSNSQFKRYIAEAEGAYLKPILDKIEKQSKSSWLNRSGGTLAGKGIKIASAVAVISALGSGDVFGAAVKGVVGEATSSLVDKLFGGKKTTGGVTVWKKLYAHRQTYSSELKATTRPGYDTQKAQTPVSRGVWNIPEKASMSVYITKGSIMDTWVRDKQNRVVEGL